MEDLKNCCLCNKDIKETQSRVMHTECNYVHRKCEEQYKNGSLKKDTRPTTDITGIVWEGKCHNCELMGHWETCPNCNGKGTITRNATIAEVVEVGKNYIAFRDEVNGLMTGEILDNIRIVNGGRLRESI